MKPESMEYVRYRISRAETTLHLAKLALDNDFLYDTVNRLYYACFFAVSARTKPGLTQAKRGTSGDGSVPVLRTLSKIHSFALKPQEKGQSLLADSRGQSLFCSASV